MDNRFKTPGTSVCLLYATSLPFVMEVNVKPKAISMESEVFWNMKSCDPSRWNKPCAAIPAPELYGLLFFFCVW